jgi:hypothetical protein
LAIGFLGEPKELHQPNVHDGRPWWGVSLPFTSGAPCEVRKPIIEDSDERGKNIKASCEAFWPEAERKIDVAVVHLGLLDKWLEGQNRPKSQVEVQRVLLRFKRIVPHVLVTSGRGRPENLPERCRFLPYSLLEASLMADHFDKLSFLTSLHSL